MRSTGSIGARAQQQQQQQQQHHHKEETQVVCLVVKSPEGFDLKGVALFSIRLLKNYVSSCRLPAAIRCPPADCLSVCLSVRLYVAEAHRLVFQSDNLEATLYLSTSLFPIFYMSVPSSLRLLYLL